VSAIARKVGCDRKTVRKYLERGLDVPVYGPRAPRERLIDQFESYLRDRVLAFPDLSGARLLREIREIGYEGSYSAVTDFLREIRPSKQSPFERRFETPPGRQAQVDFAEFTVEFTDEPGVTRKVWVPPFDWSPGPIEPFGSGFNLHGSWTFALALGALCLQPEPSIGNALPHRRFRSDGWITGAHPL